jgi:hypothetical protein
MNPSENRFNRLLDAAQQACPPVPGPSPWFEQKVMRALKAQQMSLADFFDGAFIFRMLGGAAGVMAISLILTLAPAQNPYTDLMASIDTTAQTNQLP